MNVIIVTGASSGMGREFVYQMDKKFPNIDEIWLVARREKELKRVASGCRHECRVMPLDLTSPLAVEVFSQYLEKLRVKVKVLVNCAGYGIYGPFDQIDSDDLSGMIDLNCKALTAVTYACMPYMARNSRVIQLASSAAFLPQPYFAVYAATKSYVLSLTRALRTEYSGKNIYFTAVCPGPVRTPFFERSEIGFGTLSLKKFVMAEPADVVRQALNDSRDGKQISVYGNLMKAFYVVTKIIPHRWILFIYRGILKLERKG